LPMLVAQISPVSYGLVNTRIGWKKG
jgi:hypothetical protein